MAETNSTLVLDTNAIIYFLGANPGVISLLDQKIHYISGISEIEVPGFDFKNPGDLYAVKRYLRAVKIIPLTNKIKEIAIRVKKDYKTKVGDAIVSAAAIYFDLPYYNCRQEF